MTDTVSAAANGGDTVSPANGSGGHLPGHVTTAAAADGAPLPLEFVVVLVLAAACVVVGVVYAYVHITRAARARVEKRKRRPSSAAALHHHARDLAGDDGPRQTHLMFFRRTTSAS